MQWITYLEKLNNCVIQSAFRGREAEIKITYEITEEEINNKYFAYIKSMSEKYRKNINIETYEHYIKMLKECNEMLEIENPSIMHYCLAEEELLYCGECEKFINYCKTEEIEYYHNEINKKMNIISKNLFNRFRKIMINKNKTEYLKVDGFNEAKNMVYQFHGCYWHGCQKCYPLQ